MFPRAGLTIEKIKGQGHRMSKILGLRIISLNHSMWGELIYCQRLKRSKTGQTAAYAHIMSTLVLTPSSRMNT